jgi:hypothetical protein
VTLLGYTSDPNASSRAVQFSEDGKSVTRGYDGEEHEEGTVVKGLSGEAVQILKRVDEEQVEQDLRALYDEGYRSLAVVLMHSFTYPGSFGSYLPSVFPPIRAHLVLVPSRTDHELAISRIAEKIGFSHISLSSQSLPMIRFVPPFPVFPFLLLTSSSAQHRCPRCLHDCRCLPYPSSARLPKRFLRRFRPLPSRVELPRDEERGRCQEGDDGRVYEE